MTDRAQHLMLVEALVLSLLAPTTEQADRASLLADMIATGMSPEAVEACKQAALEAVQA